MRGEFILLIIIHHERFLKAEKSKLKKIKHMTVIHPELDLVLGKKENKL